MIPDVQAFAAQEHHLLCVRKLEVMSWHESTFHG